MGKSVTHIGEWAFHGCTSLTSITLGESVTHIREWAFADCTSLTSITLGNGVEYIGAGAFARCTSLASVYLGESVPHISRFAFENCTSLANITMCPELMEKIQQDAKGRVCVFGNFSLRFEASKEGGWTGTKRWCALPETASWSNGAP